jgi:hypothetical protein
VELDGTVATWGGMAGEGRRSSGCLQRRHAPVMGSGIGEGAFCFCNIPKTRHFKNTTLNIGFAELPSKHDLHRSFASENVFPAVSPHKRMVPTATVTPWCSYCSSHYRSSLRAAWVG